MTGRDGGWHGDDLWYSDGREDPYPGHRGCLMWCAKWAAVVLLSLVAGWWITLILVTLGWMPLP
ncbi:putative membrane protein [Candidatus Protofrankia californiensis]|uniref:Putative membrane protein n=1 Tax=Candidatus Protofrankia californiensis TaxID=1839754 RepID=A0A1C3NU69_9ACTN|nr:putative membrane protein [Candidatus Protofrankia californiensis]